MPQLKHLRPISMQVQFLSERVCKQVQGRAGCSLDLDVQFMSMREVLPAISSQISLYDLLFQSAVALLIS